MSDTQALVERLRSMSRHEHDDLSIADEAANALERMAAEVEALREALKPFAERRTIEEELSDPTPPVWANATPERRIEMIGERKRQHDDDILRARQALSDRGRG
ncbi:hypothetical protein [Novosphingobium sp. JCM 18896]|uniref:hypothetical protein n=1 Tax=Novosphingobium sp. JCM 18896 TaxID=2989731 RepID=UPI0022213AC5|nr:hypothetical protein [Novosphingobium sp. JCM 18896]MCW1431352.1 hypothetical protein [Novosphingobium sp. JCM 18896]